MWHACLCLVVPLAYAMVLAFRMFESLSVCVCLIERVVGGEDRGPCFLVSLFIYFCTVFGNRWPSFSGLTMAWLFVA